MDENSHIFCGFSWDFFFEPWIIWSILFSFQIYRDFPVIFLLLVSCLISLCHLGWFCVCVCVFNQMDFFLILGIMSDFQLKPRHFAYYITALDFISITCYRSLEPLGVQLPTNPLLRQPCLGSSEVLLLVSMWPPLTQEEEWPCYQCVVVKVLTPLGFLWHHASRKCGCLIITRWGCESGIPVWSSLPMQSGGPHKNFKILLREKKEVE